MRRTCVDCSSAFDTKAGSGTRCKPCAKQQRRLRNRLYMRTAYKSRPIAGSVLVCQDCSAVTPRTGPTQLRCKDCAAVKDKQTISNWHIVNKDKSRALSLKNKRNRHGFSEEAVAFLRDLQNGECAICRVAMKPPGRGTLHECADHCHETGQPRGLLCGACNTMLGFYEKHHRAREMLWSAFERYLANPPYSAFISVKTCYNF